MGAVHHLLQGLLRGFVPHASGGVFLDRRRLGCVRLDAESHAGRPPGPLRSVADVERALIVAPSRSVSRETWSKTFVKGHRRMLPTL